MNGGVEKYRGETVVRWQREWIMPCLASTRGVAASADGGLWGTGLAKHRPYAMNGAMWNLNRSQAWDTRQLL